MTLLIADRVADHQQRHLEKTNLVEIAVLRKFPLSLEWLLGCGRRLTSSITYGCSQCSPDRPILWVTAARDEDLWHLFSSTAMRRERGELGDCVDGGGDGWVSIYRRHGGGNICLKLRKIDFIPSPYSPLAQSSAICFSRSNGPRDSSVRLHKRPHPLCSLQQRVQRHALQPLLLQESQSTPLVGIQIFVQKKVLGESLAMQQKGTVLDIHRDIKWSAES